MSSNGGVGCGSGKQASDDVRWVEEREKPMMAKAGEGMNHLLELGPYE
jgi:hypothetical protein